MPVTSPVESMTVNVGPLPPVVTLSTFWTPPALSTVKDCKNPPGLSSLTALQTDVSS
jgi:hypothetical protein